MLTYPTGSVSRTLNPAGKSLYSVVGQHDRNLSDADVNLMQDLESYKRQRLLDNQASSGPLQYAPFVFNPNLPNSFTIPAFDALVFGQTIRVAGNLSSNPAQNTVRLPAPTSWAPGQPTPAAQIYVAFLEYWYQLLDPDAGFVEGYYQDPVSGNLFFYPFGCRNPDVTTQTSLPNDTIDPFSQNETTQRVQIQWAIRVQPVDLDYDFTTYRFGLDQDTTHATMVYGYGNQPLNSALGTSAPTGVPATAPSAYPFTNMAAINGDAGVWRAGNGVVTNLLGTMDGYTYAMPLAVAFQRNTGIYNLATNPFGSALNGISPSGLLSTGISGRYDGKFADSIYPDDVVDTRSTVFLTGVDEDSLMRQGFVDLISGNTQQAIGRGILPGNSPSALGSQLEYRIAVAPSQLANTDTLGTFDGFRNGFSATDHSFTTTKVISPENKTVGVQGASWRQGDAFTVSLPSSSLGVISAVQVQALVTNFITSAVSAALLLPGQITVTGLGTSAVTVAIARNLAGTPFDPGYNNIYATVSVEYPANAGMDLRHIPTRVNGGVVVDSDSGRTLPIFAVSEYDAFIIRPSVYCGTPLSTTTVAPTAIGAVTVYNSEYSNTIFGTRINVAVAASTGVASTTASGVTTTFTIPNQNLQSALSGVYVLAAWDSVTGVSYPILGRSVSPVASVGGGKCILQIGGVVPTPSTVVVSFLCTNTAQLVYNAPTRAVTSIAETILFGNAPASDFSMDGRIAPVYVSANTAIFTASDGLLRAISGDDTNKLLWIKDINGNYDAVQLGAVSFFGGLVIVTAPATVNFNTQSFFLVGAIYPSFTPSSTLILSENYIPYQGEGKVAVDYELLHTEDFALATTNGTGAPPVPGLADVYPYNRELPIITQLPSQAAWSDSDLTNISVASLFDSNSVAKRQANVEHTLEVPVHTNDFIDPVNGDKRKAIQLLVASGGRGFAKATPHIGFAIEPLSTGVLGTQVLCTTAPIVLYVDNIKGNDLNSGLTPTSAKLTIQAATASLPNVLQHPCSIQLAATGTPYSIAAMQRAGTMTFAALGDGDTDAAKFYAISVLAFLIQGSGRLVITREANATTPVTIDCTGYAPYGDGPTSAFFIDGSRVIFNGIEFKNFVDQAIKGVNARVDFVDCLFTTCLTAGSFEQGCSVILDGGNIVLGTGGTGMILSQSDLDVSNTTWTVATGATPNAFFVAERGSSLTLDQHSVGEESGTASSTLMAWAQLNSNIACTENFLGSLGAVLLQANSVLSRTVAITPFLGGITSDASSNVVTSL